MSETKTLRCHRCRSENLILRETRHEHAEWDGGLIVDADGQIRAWGDGIFTPGDIQSQLTRIECEDCGHDWHPRRWFAGSTAEEDR